MKKNLLKWVIPVVVLSACGKDEILPPPTPDPSDGVYILSEGNFGGNNAKLSYRDNSTGVVSGDFYRMKNNEDLGDVANDAIIYGAKMYIVMNGTSNVTVINAKTGVLIKKIPFMNGAAKKQPRYAVGTKGKVYVTAYDNTVSVIDTSALTIVKTIDVGANPEGIAQSGNYLFVANSGGLNANQEYDSTVSVIDLNTQLEVRKVKVGLNPQRVAVNSVGDVYVSSFGDYGSVKAAVHVIRNNANTVSTVVPGAEFSSVYIYDNLAYFSSSYGASVTAKVYNTITGQVVRDNFVTDGTEIATPYSLDVDQNGDVYVGDARDYVATGIVTVFDMNGKEKTSFSVSPGVLPKKVLFVSN